MEWINYKEKKPTSRKSLYLIEYGWHPDVSVIKTAYWNGKSFYDEDWEDCQTILYKDQVRHWFEIVKPNTEGSK